jgi:hypothetical protein
MRKAALIISLLISVAGVTFAGVGIPAPEIDSSTGVSALALLGGAFVIVMARRKR